MPPRGFSLNTSPQGILKAGRVDQKIQAGLLAAAAELRNQWEVTLRQPGKGELYTEALRTVSFNGVFRVIPVGPRTPTSTHRASSPGDPPATDSGVSANSIFVGDIPNKRRGARVGTDRRHLRYLQWGVGPQFEYGPHPAGIVIEPRPHGDIALASAERRMIKAFRAEMRAT